MAFRYLQSLFRRLKHHTKRNTIKLYQLRPFHSLLRRLKHHTKHNAIKLHHYPYHLFSPSSRFSIQYFGTTSFRPFHSLFRRLNHHTKHNPIKLHHHPYHLFSTSSRFRIQSISHRHHKSHFILHSKRKVTQPSVDRRVRSTAINATHTNQRRFGGHTSVGRIQQLIMKHPAQAFISQTHLSETWRDCLFVAEPNFKKACFEFDSLLNVLRSHCIDPILLPHDNTTTADSIHTHDSMFVYNDGYLPMNFAKKSRVSEVLPMTAAFEELEVLHCKHLLSPSAHVEAGDFIWLNDRTVCVGNGYRTDSSGIRELKRIFGDAIDIIDIHLPHFEGPMSCLHLLSVCSPLSTDTWLVYKRAIPVTFLRFLEEQNIKLLEVADEEWHSWGSNVLAIDNGILIATEGNPKTLKRLISAGMDVTVIKATNICALTGGGPTCITRPVLRESV